MKTPYGEIRVGDVYRPADGSGGKVRVVDVDTYAECQDVIIEDEDGNWRRMDWFKLMRVRYSYEGNAYES
jgi:hypothetical protein